MKIFAFVLYSLAFVSSGVFAQNSVTIGPDKIELSGHELKGYIPIDDDRHMIQIALKKLTSNAISSLLRDFEREQNPSIFSDWLKWAELSDLTIDLLKRLINDHWDRKADILNLDAFYQDLRNLINSAKFTEDWQENPVVGTEGANFNLLINTRFSRDVSGEKDRLEFHSDLEAIQD